MKTRFTFIVGVITAVGVLAVTAQGHEASKGAETVVPAFSGKLPNVPGKTLTAVVVTYAPGTKSPPHHHAGSVYAYVLSGQIRSANSATGPARVYKAGESFFEPPASEHTISENASDSEPASLLAVFITDESAVLTSSSE